MRIYNVKFCLSSGNRGDMYIYATILKYTFSTTVPCAQISAPTITQTKQKIDYR